MREGTVKEVKCYKCGAVDNLIRNNKHSHVCNPCNTARHKAYRATEKGKERQYAAVLKYTRSHPERVRAWSSVNHRKPDKQPCEICGDAKVHAHHDRPEMTLDILWLCPRHHKQRHAALKSLEAVA